MEDKYKEKYYELYNKLEVEAPPDDDDYAAWVADKEQKKRCSYIIGCVDGCGHSCICC
jgi:hypothetical protein